MTQIKEIGHDPEPRARGMPGSGYDAGSLRSEIEPMFPSPPASAAALEPPFTPDAGQARRLVMVRRLALICAALMLATIVLSAFMRLSQAGLGCADWPACYGQNLSSVAQAPAPGTAVIVARMLHRIVASLVLVLVIMLTLSTLAMRPRLHVEGRLSAVMLLLTLALSALGVVTAGATLPAVTLGNLIGGFLMLALCWRLAATPASAAAPVARMTHQARTPLQRWAALALAMLLVQVALGALVSGSYAALSCQGWADCSKSAAAAGWDWQAMNPWHRPQLADLPFNPGGALAQLAHRLGALLLPPLFAVVALLAWRRQHRTEALLLLSLLALQATLGWAGVAAGLPIALVLMHNLNAALMLALLTRLA